MAETTAANPKSRGQNAFYAWRMASKAMIALGSFLKPVL